jgi:two-component system, OmpR family, KDP operon response regulator KdpE
MPLRTRIRDLSHLTHSAGALPEAVSERSVAPVRHTVLTCDPTAQDLRGLGVVLRDAGFAVVATTGFEEALDRAAVRALDAAIVELALRDGDGIDLCRRLRDWSTMPLIVVSRAATENDTLLAFEAGADDFLRKPFAPRELVARLGAIFRRTQPALPGPILDLDGVRVDVGEQTVRRGEQEIHLTPTEFRLLCLLARHRGRLLTHHLLLQEVWGPAYLDARDTLRSHIANLRRKIDPANDGLPLIKTYQGAGYSLVGNPSSAVGSHP